MDMQDYNHHVIRLVTTPNLFLQWTKGEGVLNMEQQDLAAFVKEHEERVNMYAGDWSSLPSVARAEGYDWVLASEVLYNASNYSVFLSACKRLLKPNGSLLVASKVVYFGCTGDVHTFTRAAQNSGFSVRTVATIDSAVKRVILLLRHQS
jgi:ubiquinone/menaquinone biosynthesis C-methylase UbiE